MREELSKIRTHSALGHTDGQYPLRGIPRTASHGAEGHGGDKYRRTLAEVLLPDGTNVNHMLVK